MFIRPISNHSKNEEVIEDITSIFKDEFIVITDKKYIGYCENVIKGILEDSIEIWGKECEKQNLDNFTDHGLNHSIRIINYFLKFLEAYEISDKELFIFIISAFIHDYGMQLNYFKKAFIQNGKKDELKEFEDYFFQQNKQNLEYTDSFIREFHGEIGYCFISYYLEKKKSEGKYNFCRFLPASNELDLIKYGSLIGFSHCSDNFRKELENNGAFEDRYEGNARFRPHLLAGLMMLCDLFDCDKRRVSKPENIRTARVPEYSKLHWLACYLINKVVIKQEDNAFLFRILIEWRYPTSFSGDQISKYLLEFRILEIDKYLKEIPSMFEDEYIQRYFYKLEFSNVGKKDEIMYWDMDFTELVEKASELVEKASEKITDTSELVEKAVEMAEVVEEVVETSELVEETVETSEFVEETTEISSKSKLENIVANNSSKEKEKVFSSGSFNPFIDFAHHKKPTDIILDLEKWVEKNSIEGHFELNTGDHTNVFFHCRTLFSDSLMVNKISNEIKRKILENHQDINCVMGIGTSSIPIAVNLAHLFKCSSTFTFYSEKINETFFKDDSQEESKNDLDSGLTKDPKKIKKDRYSMASECGYEFYEVLPTIPDNSNVLIIDDIVSSGNLVNRILSKLKIPRENIFCYSILRLGTRGIVNGGIYFDHLLAIPEVEYWDKDNCNYCNMGFNPVVERNMF